MNIRLHAGLHWLITPMVFVVAALLSGLAHARAPECGVQALAIDDEHTSSYVKNIICKQESDAVALDLMRGKPAERGIAKLLLQDPSAAAPPRRLSPACKQELEPLIRPKYELLRRATSLEEFAAISPIFEPDDFAQLSPDCQPFTATEWASLRARQTYLITALLRPGDTITIVEDDPQNSSTMPKQPLVVLDQYSDGEVLLFMRNADADATAFITQPDADVIWTHEFSYADHSGLHWRQTT